MNALKLSTGLKWLSLACLAAAFAVHFSTDYALGGASPLALLLALLAGWLLRQKSALAAGLLMAFAGAALLTFPFLNVAPVVYSLLALPLIANGLAGAWQWWNR